MARNKINVVSGIYLIENRESKKAYVGSSEHIYARWEEHISELDRNVHHKRKGDEFSNTKMQNAWNSHGGITAFEFRIVEECPIGMLSEREDHWFQTYPKEMRYNSTDIVPTQRGMKRGEETLAKMREITNRRIESGEFTCNAKEVRQISLDGKEIAIFQSAAEATRALGLRNRSAVSQVISGGKKTAGGFYWKLVGDDTPVEEQRTCYRSKIRVSSNGERKTYLTVEDLRADGYDPQIVNQVCRGDKKSHQGFFWEHAEVV